MITAFLAYKDQLGQTLTALIEQWINLRLLDVHLERVADIALTDREVGIDAPTQDCVMKGRIDLAYLRFRYAIHDPEILRGVSMTIQPGGTSPSPVPRFRQVEVILHLAKNIAEDGLIHLTVTRGGVCVMSSAAAKSTASRYTASWKRHLRRDRDASAGHPHRSAAH